MESEYIFAGFDIDSIVFQNKIIMAVKFFAARNVDGAQIKTQSDQVSKRLSRYISTSHINLFEACQLCHKINDTRIFQVCAAEEADLAEKFALAQSGDSSICNLSTFWKWKNL